MIKRTLYFGNPAYLKTQNEQLVIELPQTGQIQTIPIEDIGLLITDHAQITLTQGLLSKLLFYNVALVSCGPNHHPMGMFLNYEANSLLSQKSGYQIQASSPLKKQLWAQTVSAKIYNQAQVLLFNKAPNQLLFQLAQNVQSGDSTNNEAQAAAYYWKRVFPSFLAFSRNPNGDAPNNLLNYGYAIVRALVARSIAGSGLLPSVGIHHKNQYNAFCLADDIMEPYRPYVDLLVCNIIRANGKYLELNTTIKKQLLQIPVLDVCIDGKTSPLMNAVQRTTASLVKCFEGSQRKILYPKIIDVL
jgi:CRISPR-associated protein Cas1